MCCFCKQKTAYEMCISDWSSDVCSSDLIPEVVNQVAFAVVGADMTVTMAVEGGQLQLNAFEPVIAHSIFQSMTWMQQAMWTLRVNCIEGKIGRASCRERVCQYV